MTVQSADDTERWLDWRDEYAEFLGERRLRQKRMATNGGEDKNE